MNKLSFDEDILPPQKLAVLKTYGDFKRLNTLLLASDLDAKLPVLPPKLNDQGVKRTTASIQADLA